MTRTCVRRWVVPLAVLAAMTSAVQAEVHWTASTCPPNAPFTYCTVAEGGWTMVRFHVGWRYLALMSPWRIDVLDPFTGEQLASLQPPRSLEFLIGPAFSKDESLIACPVSDGTVRVWDWRTGQELQAFPGSSWGNTPVFSHDGKLLAALGPTKEVVVWDMATGAALHTFAELSLFDGPFVLGFSNGDRWVWARAIAPGSAAHITGVWDLTTGQLVRLFPGLALVPGEGAVYLLEPRPDGRTQVWRWHQDSERLVPLFLGPGPMCGASLTRGGSILALAVNDGSVRLLDVTQLGREIYKLELEPFVPGKRPTLVYAFFSPDDQFLATATWVSGTGGSYVHIYNVSGLWWKGG